MKKVELGNVRNSQGSSYGSEPLHVKLDIFIWDYHRYVDVAAKRPVIVSEAGKAGVVLISLEEYSRLIRGD